MYLRVHACMCVCVCACACSCVRARMYACVCFSMHADILFIYSLFIVSLPQSKEEKKIQSKTKYKS